MEWRDEGVVLAVRPHGETSAIAEVFTRAHGRHLGLVRGGRSRRMRPVLQIGNYVEAVWKARLAEHLGNLTVELNRGYAAAAMDSRMRLSGLTSLCWLARLLAERDPHPALFEVTLFVLGTFDHDEVWPALYARWELALLDELGFGLDLSRCAVTGVEGGLTYVSPKSGRAVSAEAGAPYADKLLRLPRFLLRGEGRTAEAGEVADAMALTGYFLETRVLAPRELSLPESRRRMLAGLGGA